MLFDVRHATTDAQNKQALIDAAGLAVTFGKPIVFDHRLYAGVSVAAASRCSRSS